MTVAYLLSSLAYAVGMTLAVCAVAAIGARLTRRDRADDPIPDETATYLAQRDALARAYEAHSERGWEVER
jgi:hypothetical protein